MAYIINGKKVKRIGVLLEPSSHGCDLNPVDMQAGRTAIVRGKKITGTGKAFEFAEYGSKRLRSIVDNNGVERFGASIKLGENANVVFIAPNIGDIILQDNYLVNITNSEISTLGTNQTTGGEINAYYDTDRIIVYLTDYSQERTVLRYFAGKDNMI